MEVLGASDNELRKQGRGKRCSDVDGKDSGKVGLCAVRGLTGWFPPKKESSPEVNFRDASCMK